MAIFRAYATDSEDEGSVASTSSRRHEDAPSEISLEYEDTPATNNRNHAHVDTDESEEEYDEEMTEEEEEEENEKDEEEEEETETESEETESSDMEEEDARIVDETVLPWTKDITVDPNRMKVMQQSLFRMPEEAAAMKEIAQHHPSRKRIMFSNNLSRKHSRDSEGDGLRADSRQRASFAHDLEPAAFKPSRKYARIEFARSTPFMHESALIDSGLSLGRSFRVGWGPGGKLVHIGSLCAPSSKPSSPSTSSTVTVSTVPCLAPSSFTTKLLVHHLQNSVVEPDYDDVPFANPTKLDFSSFVSLFPPEDQSFEATLFRLGKTLFDPINVGLPESAGYIREIVPEIRRKAALSKWLEAVVAPVVEGELQERPTAHWATTVFSLLTGHQIEKACDAAMDAGNVKLATLLAQLPGDADFREDLRAQLDIWREQRVDVHIDETVRKIYALLSGNASILSGSDGTGVERCNELALAHGLDWKRAFGLHLWYGEPMDAPISSAFHAYDFVGKQVGKETAPPAPWYRELPSSPTNTNIWKLPSVSSVPDALHSLLRLYSEPQCSLSEILHPYSFRPSPLDYQLPWHLYIILSRCLRVRDFADRGEVDVSQDEQLNDDEPPVEGHSPSADLLANSYAMQLEQSGMIQEAAFVILHLEGSAGRKRAIKELLCRSAPKLEDWLIRGLIGSLKIPMSWIHEAKAIYAANNDDMYNAYEHYIAAGMFSAAHELAVLKLAPDAVIREDLSLLKDLFQKIANHSVEVDGWNVRGKAFLDYAHAMTRLPQLKVHLVADAVPDAAQATELEELTRSVPKLITRLPDLWPDSSDVRYKIAISEMISGLTKRLDQVRPLAIEKQLRTAHASEIVRMKHVTSSAYERFLRTIEVA
ncbi:nuclear protein 96-domain-containing protein [Abortiporus biennis]|nr:nuclear protein 96-domain-containing protein [Abortiporus biennis]